MAGRGHAARGLQPPLPRAPYEFTDTTAALEEILKLNATLPQDRRIRVVSISNGWTLSQVARPDVMAFMEVIRRAEAAGVAVVHCGATMFPTPFSLAGAPPFRDRNSPDSYEIPLMIQRSGGSMVPKELLAPGDYLTLASEKGPDDYVYYAEGGRSWAAPFLAGLVALALQVKPDVPLPELYRALDTTATKNARGLKIVNPVAFIDAVRQIRTAIAPFVTSRR